MTPCPCREAPANFNMLPHRRIKRSSSEPRETSEYSIDLYSPQSEPILYETLLYSLNRRIRFLLAQHIWEITHHFQIRIQLSERFVIFLNPSTK